MEECAFIGRVSGATSGLDCSAAGTMAGATCFSRSSLGVVARGGSTAAITSVFTSSSGSGALSSLSAPACVESKRTRSSISSWTSGAGGIERQLAITLRSLRASMRSAFTSGVGSRFVRNSIVRSSDRSSEAKDDDAAGVPLRAALSTGPSGLGVLLELPLGDDPQHRREAEAVDFARVKEAIVEEQPAHRGEADAEHERGDEAAEDDDPVGDARGASRLEGGVE